MRRIFVALAVMLSMAVPAMAVDFEFHGDMNHQFRLMTNQNGFMMADTSRVQTDDQDLISDDSTNESFALFKYRLWTTASSDNGAVKGVFAAELGGIRFGDSDNGGGFTGDGKNIEIRWAYTDFALGNGRVKVGLQPFSVNKFFWAETATGVDYKVGNLELAWMRGYEVTNTDGDNDFKDLDGLYVRYNVQAGDNVKIGLFGTWLTSDGLTTSDTVTTAGSVDVSVDENGVVTEEVTAESTSFVGAPDLNYAKEFKGIDLDLYTFGVDGGMTAGNLFANWDLMYQTGDYAEGYDFGGYFGHFDLGAKIGKGKLTYTFWYASGDDDRTDDDLDAFVSVDVDISAAYSSIVLFEGYTDDNFFSTVPYIQDKGFIMNRIGYDFKATDKLTVNVAAMYMMTAEDIETDTNDDGLTDYEDDSIGFELDAGVSYQMYKGLELAIQVGYLMADDALDFYEVDQDGSSDEDIYVVNSRIRYKF